MSYLLDDAMDYGKIFFYYFIFFYFKINLKINLKKISNVFFVFYILNLLRKNFGSFPINQLVMKNLDENQNKPYSFLESSNI